VSSVSIWSRWAKRRVCCRSRIPVGEDDVFGQEKGEELAEQLAFMLFQAIEPRPVE
jgi:hypothetical protein